MEHSIHMLQDEEQTLIVKFRLMRDIIKIYENAVAQKKLLKYAFIEMINNDSH